jgi:hypothetical protein
MRQPARAIIRWALIETLVIQILGGWVSRRIGWPVTYPATWAVYVLAGREGSRRGPLRYALLAGGAVALVARTFSNARLAFKGLDPFGIESAPHAVFLLFMFLAAGVWGGVWGLFGGLIGHLHQRRALLAFLMGIAPVLLAVTQLRTHGAFTKFVLWPAILLVGLVPRHNIGTADKPFYEGTPIHLLAAYLGFVLSLILYSGIAYALLAWIQRGRAHRRDLDQVGA